jgi:hypothetical protein
MLITGQDKLDEADQLFNDAYAWRPGGRRSPSRSRTSR